MVQMVEVEKLEKRCLRWRDEFGISARLEEDIEWRHVASLACDADPKQPNASSNACNFYLRNFNAAHHLAADGHGRVSYAARRRNLSLPPVRAEPPPRRTRKPADHGA